MKKAAVVVFLGAVFASSAYTQKPASTKGATTTLSAQRMLKRLTTTVFIVETLSGTGSVVESRTAVAVASDEVVTTKGVIRGGMMWRVRQGSKTWPATLSHLDPHHDLCQLRAEGLNAPPVSVRASSTLVIGERVYAIGSPDGLEPSLSEGLISGLEFEKNEETTLINTTGATIPGSSTDGLFDVQGRLVGITTTPIFKMKPKVEVVGESSLPGETVQALALRQVSASQLQEEQYQLILSYAETADNNLLMAQSRRLLKYPDYKIPKADREEIITLPEFICSESDKSCRTDWTIGQHARYSLRTLRKTIFEMQPSRDEFEKDFLDPARSVWSTVRELYCHEYPGAPYVDLEGETRTCKK
jgi:hypothetical protein